MPCSKPAVAGPRLGSSFLGSGGATTAREVCEDVQTPRQEAAMRATEETVREYLRAREAPDLELLDEVVAEGFVHEMRGEQQDRAGLFAEVNALGKVFADMRHEVGALFSSGEQVACQYTFYARHVGAMRLSERLAEIYGAGWLPATDRTIRLPGMFIAIVRGGQLRTGWGEYDRLGLMMQLGVLESSAGGRPPQAVG
jgi:predicted ester cyclase